MKRITKITAMVITILLVLSLAGCGQKNEPKTQTPANSTSNTTTDTNAWPPIPALNPPVTVKIGNIGAIGGAGYYIATEKGYFKDLGINIEFIGYDSAAKAIPMVANNQVDVVGGAVSAGLFNAAAQGFDMKIIAGIEGAQKDHATTLMMVRKDLIDSGAVKSVKDLKGKTIASTSKGSITNVVLAYALAKEGLTIKDVKVAFMGFPDMLTAFGTKGIDAAIIVEPVATKAVGQGFAVKFLGGDEIQLNQQIGVLFGSPNFTANKEVSQRFMVAYLKGVREYREAFIKKEKSKDEIVNILVKYMSLKDPAAYDKITLPDIDPNGKFNTESITRDMEWLVTNGDIQKKPDLNKILLPDLAQYAVSKIGEYKY
jgi:NitT/TauT family transport system substrate-binding protein